MPGPEDLLLGPALGVMLQQLYTAFQEARAKSKKFDKALTNLQETIELVTPKIKEIDKMNQNQDNFSKGEILVLLTLLEKGNDLLYTCSKISRWNKYKRHRYFKRIDELDSTLRRLVSVEVQVEQLLDIKQLFSEMAEINNKLGRLNLQKMTDSLNENDTQNPGVTMEGESVPDPRQSTHQGTTSRFEIRYRRRNENGETEFNINF